MEEEAKQPEQQQEQNQPEEEKVGRKEKKVLKENADLKAQLETLGKENLELKTKYLTTLADMQNLRKQLENDHREAIKYRSEGFLEGLLPALDSFYMALSVTPNGQEAINYQLGFQYIYNQIEHALEEEGVKSIEPKVGDPFDSTIMHAVDVAEGEEEGKILKVYSKGYKLYDRLVRPVMVLVSKKKSEPKTEETQPEPSVDEGHMA